MHLALSCPAPSIALWQVHDLSVPDVGGDLSGLSFHGLRTEDVLTDFIYLARQINFVEPREEISYGLLCGRTRACRREAGKVVEKDSTASRGARSLSHVHHNSYINRVSWI